MSDVEVGHDFVLEGKRHRYTGRGWPHEPMAGALDGFVIGR